MYERIKIKRNVVKNFLNILHFKLIIRIGQYLNHDILLGLQPPAAHVVVLLAVGRVLDRNQSVVRVPRVLPWSK